MKECKYRLPCNWCDRLNKYCDMVEPIKIELPDSNNCDHDWEYSNTVKHTGGDYIHYRCRKCGELRVKTYDGFEYESGKWQP